MTTTMENAKAQIGPSTPSAPATHDLVRETVGRLELAHNVADRIIANGFGEPTAVGPDTDCSSLQATSYTATSLADSLHTKLCQIEHRLFGG